MRSNPAFRARFAAALKRQMQRANIHTAYALHRAMKKHGTDIAMGSVYQYCKGEQSPQLEVAVGIAKALGCTVDELVREQQHNSAMARATRHRATTGATSSIAALLPE